ncbi:hypothetical protein CATMIT_01690, partial [Catenibacterium mitsuokai DSM 15897]
RILGHPQHFLDRGQPGHRLDDAVLVHGAHARGLARDLFDLAHAGMTHHRAAQLVVHDQEFHDRGAPVITAGRGRRRARTIQIDLAFGLIAAQAELLDFLRRGRVFLRVGRLQSTHQALGQDAVDGRGQQIVFHAHVEQPGDAAGGVVGVQRAEHQVSGQRRLDRDLARLQIAHFADHDDVR